MNTSTSGSLGKPTQSPGSSVGSVGSVDQQQAEDVFIWTLARLLAAFPSLALTCSQIESSQEIVNDFLSIFVMTMCPNQANSPTNPNNPSSPGNLRVSGSGGGRANGRRDRCLSTATMLNFTNLSRSSLNNPHNSVATGLPGSKAPRTGRLTTLSTPSSTILALQALTLLKLRPPARVDEQPEECKGGGCEAKMTVQRAIMWVCEMLQETSIKDLESYQLLISSLSGLAQLHNPSAVSVLFPQLTKVLTLKFRSLIGKPLRAEETEDNKSTEAQDSTSSQGESGLAAVSEATTEAAVEEEDWDAWDEDSDDDDLDATQAQANSTSDAVGDTSVDGELVKPLGRFLRQIKSYTSSAMPKETRCLCGLRQSETQKFSFDTQVLKLSIPQQDLVNWLLSFE